MRKLILETDFDSPAAQENIKELLLATSSTAVDSIGESGNVYAKGYAIAGLTPEYHAKEKVLGLSQLYLNMQLLKDSSASLQPVIDKLKLIQQFALSNNRGLRVAVTCGAESRTENESQLSQFLSTLPKTSNIHHSSMAVSNRINLDYSKAFLRLPFQVSHVGLAVPGVEYVNPQGASLSILSQLLTHKHLHREIREKGGAYGAGAASYGLGGIFAMSSYRDPVPDRTVLIMRKAGEWATQYDFSKSDIEEAKLSIFKGLDSLEDIHQEGMMQFMNGIDPIMQKRRREQLLDVGINDVKEAAQEFLVDGMASARTMIIGGKAPKLPEIDWRELAKPIKMS